MDNYNNSPQMSPMEHDSLSEQEEHEQTGREGHPSEVQSLLYHHMPLCKIPVEHAVALTNKLYSPGERFADGFYRYWLEKVNMPHEEAWQATLEELQMYIDYLVENLDDPHWHTVGFLQNGEYKPVGIYGLRELLQHQKGPEILQILNQEHLRENYTGRLAMAHSFSALKGYRNRLLMKYSFLMIAREAIEQNYNHIFFFMSDDRLGPIYRRFGLEFPDNLRFPDSKHLVGSYTPKLHLDEINKVSAQFGFGPYDESVLTTD